MGRKKEEEEKLLSKWYIYQRGWLMVFFFLSFLFIFGLGFGFWFLVFYCRVTRVARGVFLGGWGLGWGWGSLYNIGESFALDWTTGTCYLFIDEMGGGKDRKGTGGRAASGRFLLKIENRQKSATVGLGRGFFFVFMRLVGW